MTERLDHPKPIRLWSEMEPMLTGFFTDKLYTAEQRFGLQRFARVAMQRNNSINLPQDLDLL